VTAVLATVPPLVALALLLGRAHPIQSAAAALLVAVPLAMLAFDASAGVMLRGEWHILPTALEVVLIILGGVLLNQLLGNAGAHRALGDWLREVCRDRGRTVLLVVLGVTPFIESVTGFGVGVVVAAPLLLHLGFSRRNAAVIALLGLVIVPWGALAPGTLVAAQLTDVSFHDLGVRTAALSLPVFLICGAAALLVGVGARRALAALPELVMVAGTLWAGVWAVNRWLGTPLAGALGSLFGVAAALALARVRDRARLRLDRAVTRALSVYLVLVLGLVLSRAVLAVLGGTGATAGWWGTALTSPATWLLLTSALAPLLLRGRTGDQRRAVASALSHWWPVATTTALFLGLGALMVSSGMSAALAAGAAGRLHTGYLALAPWIGGLGGFITGSNTGANAMFAASQGAAAKALGYPVVSLVGLQNVSASLTTMASAPRVALAVSLLQAPEPPGGPAGAEARPAGAEARPAPPPGGPRSSGTSATTATDPRPATREAAVPPPEPVDTSEIFRFVLAVDGIVLAVLSVLAALST
jgi:lactate permease